MRFETFGYFAFLGQSISVMGKSLDFIPTRMGVFPYFPNFWSKCSRHHLPCTIHERDETHTIEMGGVGGLGNISSINKGPKLGAGIIQNTKVFLASPHSLASPYLLSTLTVQEYKTKI